MVGRVGPIWWPHREVRRCDEDPDQRCRKRGKLPAAREHCQYQGDRRAGSHRYGSQRGRTPDEWYPITVGEGRHPDVRGTGRRRNSSSITSSP